MKLESRHSSESLIIQGEKRGEVYGVGVKSSEVS